MKKKIIFAVGSLVLIFLGGSAFAEGIKFKAFINYCDQNKWESVWENKIQDGSVDDKFDFLSDNDPKKHVYGTWSLAVDKFGKIKLTRRADRSFENIINTHRMYGQLDSNKKYAKLSGDFDNNAGGKAKCDGWISFEQDPTPLTVSSAVSNAVGSADASATSMSSLSDEVLCSLALTNSHSAWSMYGKDQAAVNTAQRRGLSIETCAAKLVAVNNSVDQTNLELQQTKLKLDETQAQLDKLNKQIADQQTQGSRLVATDQLVASARGKIDVLTRSANSYQNIQVAMRADYEVRIKTQIQQLRSRISLLTVAKVTAANSEEIKQLEGQLEALSTRTFENEKSYQELQARSDELAQQISETKNTLSAELARTKKDLDDQRKQDLASIGNQFADLGATVQANKQKAAKDVADIKAMTQSEIGQLKSDLGALDARVADLEKGQQNLATKQAELSQQQSNTDKRVTATNQLLANILLPVSERPDDWMMRVAAVPVQQQQFCRIVDRFYDDLAAVYKVRNDIKKNALYKDRHQDLAALLPGGAINSWVVRVVEVTQAKDGSAAIMLQPPCRAMLGSDACVSDQKKFRATVAPGSLMYRELARINAGDFVTISGKILYAEGEGDDKPLPEYALYQPGKHCTEADGAKTQDVFVTELMNLAVLK
jgi:predicted  nucleic acid-binding Zn-ribbon protein